MEEKKVQLDTIIRTIAMIVTIVNQLLLALGKNPLPFAEDFVYSFLSTLATVVVQIWVWWKNNSFTKEAIIADEYMHMLKNNRDSEVH